MNWCASIRIGSAVALGLARMAGAEPLSGLCPDGSAFIVQDRADIPCAHAKLVEPSDLPPLRPHLLPRPYGWLVDQQARDPQNPYNLIDGAEKIRDSRRAQSPEAAGVGAGEPTPSPRVEARTAPPSTPTVAEPIVPRIALETAELEDLFRLVNLRQRVAPAELVVDDIHGDARLEIRFAASQVFETRFLEAMGSRGRVLVFAARASRPLEFHPNFLVVQAEATFRPDPTDRREIGFLAGEPGMLEPGAVVLGYLWTPARFDPSRSLELWWNDRRIDAVLLPDSVADPS